MNSYITLLKQFDVSESVFLSVCLCVRLFPNCSETVNPNDLKILGIIPLDLQMVLG